MDYMASVSEANPPANTNDAPPIPDPPPTPPPPLEFALIQKVPSNYISELKTVSGSYKGYVHDGRPHGFGILTWTNDAKSFGIWENGTIQKGMTKHPGGEYYYGSFISNLKEDTSKVGIHKSQNSVYIGKIENNIPEGPSIVEWNNGVKYYGNWSDNKMHGEGILFKNGVQLHGTWQNGSMTGIFHSIQDMDSDIPHDVSIIEVEFENNEISSRRGLVVPDERKEVFDQINTKNIEMKTKFAEANELKEEAEKMEMRMKHLIPIFNAYDREMSIRRRMSASRNANDKDDEARHSPPSPSPPPPPLPRLPSWDDVVNGLKEYAT